ncbi:MAG: phosphodiester glycosidase family protein [Candidatus Bipolaricaulia bacterium]
MPNQEVQSVTKEVTDSGEVLLSPHSRVVHTLREALNRGQLFLKDGKLVSDDDASAGLIDSLYQNDNIYVESTPSDRKKLQFKTQLVPVTDNCGFTSQLRYSHEILMNSSFFLLEPSDMKSIHSLFCQAYGLVMDQGEILHPPLFPRGALLRGKSGSKVEVLSIKDVDIRIGGTKFRISDNCEVFTRFETDRSPEDSDKTHVGIVNDRVVSYKEGGGLQVPDAGFVLTIEKSQFSKLDPSSQVKYSWREGLGQISPNWGIQVGPVLYKDGSARHTFGKEAFSESHPPTVFPYNWNQTPAARLALAITEEEEPLILAVEGCNDSDYYAGFDSRGATLEDLVELLNENNIKCALNLDGGGSTSLYFKGGSCIKKADRRKLPGVAYERPVPLVITGQKE